MAEYKLNPCSRCSADYLGVDWLQCRVDGFCSVQCMKDDETDRFERWYAKCATIAVSDPRTPGEYRWSLKEPGKFLARFKTGMTPEDAVNAEFFTH